MKISKERLSELRSQIQELGETQVPDLLRDVAALQVSRVLHGDYDLKIARQDYFTSKQDKVYTAIYTYSLGYAQKSS